MRRFYILGFLILAGFDTVGQIGFKLTAASASPLAADLAWFGRIAGEKWVYLALAGYLGSFVTWMTLLKHAPIGPAFAASHLEIVAVLLVSVSFFEETLSAPQVLGSVFILIGIMLLAGNEERAPGETPASGDPP